MEDEPLTYAHCESATTAIERFKKLDKPIVYNATITLDAYIAKEAKLRMLFEKREAKLKELEGIRLEFKKADKDLTKFESSFLVQTGETFGKESDEYVWAGGTRPSVASEKTRITRAETQRLEAERLQAAEAQRKADELQRLADEAVQKAEFERLKAAEAQKK